MKLHNLHAPEGSTRKPVRKGRGTATGQGKTAGRGQKGQNSRSGGGVRMGFEGGQMPLTRRVQMRGFSNYRFKKLGASDSETPYWYFNPAKQDNSNPYYAGMGCYNIWQ